jgi:hypothetical protein
MLFKIGDDEIEVLESFDIQPLTEESSEKYEGMFDKIEGNLI